MTIGVILGVLFVLLFVGSFVFGGLSIRSHVKGAPLHTKCAAFS